MVHFPARHVSLPEGMHDWEPIFYIIEMIEMIELGESSVGRIISWEPIFSISPIDNLQIEASPHASAI